MENRALFDRNLLALSTSHPELCEKLGHVKEKSSLSMETSRSGKWVPVLKHEGRNYYLHSRFDPEKEGNRFLEMYPGGGCFIFLGLGGGYHIQPFLKRHDISLILIVDKDLTLFKDLLSSMDLRELIFDKRVRFLIDYTPEEMERFLLSEYIPGLSGNLQTVMLRQRLQINQDYFQEISDAVRTTINIIADDFTVQTYFGKKWFTNILANLPKSEASIARLKPVKKAIVTAAGPSLEDQIHLIKKQKESAYLIATDTSLPVLLKFDITPDVVVSIDCQDISYHHFIQGYPREVPLVLDLASPPDLTRYSDNTVFISSSHPLSQYINAHFRHFPFIDISGGNVAHAAISLGNELGAKEIYLYGADFSYPEGKAYSRGTYVYPYFMTKEDRFSSLESQMFSFMLRNINIEKEKVDDYFRYTTKPMISYKNRLEEFSLTLDSKVIPVQGKGVKISIPEKDKKKSPYQIVTLFSAGKAHSDWKSFLTMYLKDLESLPEPEAPIHSYFSGLQDYQRALWTTLFPVLAVLRKNYPPQGIPSPVELLNELKEWSCRTVARYI